MSERRYDLRNRPPEIVKRDYGTIWKLSLFTQLPNTYAKDEHTGNTITIRGMKDGQDDGTYELVSPDMADMKGTNSVMSNYFSGLGARKLKNGVFVFEPDNLEQIINKLKGSVINKTVGYHFEHIYKNYDRVYVILAFNTWSTVKTPYRNFNRLKLRRRDESFKLISPTYYNQKTEEHVPLIKKNFVQIADNKFMLKEVFKTPYVQQNVSKSSCFVDLLVDATGMTYEKVLAELYPERVYQKYKNSKKELPKYDPEQDNPFTIEDIKKIAEEKQISIHLFDPFGDVVLRHVPERGKTCSLFKEKTIYGVVQNEHIYPINMNREDMESFIGKYNDDVQQNKKMKLTVSSKFHEQAKTKDTPIYIITTEERKGRCDYERTITEVIQLMKERNETKAKCIANTHIMTILYEYIKLMKDVPIVNGTEARITSFAIAFNETLLEKGLDPKGTLSKETNQKYSIHVSNVCDSQGNTIRFNDPLQYKEYVRLNDKMTQLLINKKYLSYYNEELLKQMNDYTRGGFQALDEENKIMYRPPEYNYSVDINRMYLHVLRKLAYVPVVCKHDKFVEFDASKQDINENNFYLVACGNKPNIYISDKINFCYGEFLREMYHNGVVKEKQILYELTPSYLMPFDVEPFVKELYDNKIINEAHRKIIPNIGIGKTAISVKTKAKWMLFNNQEEALYYAEKHEGKAHCIVPIADYMTDLYNTNKTQEEDEEQHNKTLFAFKKTAETTLTQGHKLITMFVFDGARYELYKLKRFIDNECLRGDLKKLCVKPIAYNTDAIYLSNIYYRGKWTKSMKHIIEKLDGYVAEADKNKLESIGKFKIQEPSKIRTEKFMEIIDRPTPEVKRVITKQLKFKDGITEYSENNYSIIRNYTIVLAETSGSGKSSLVKRYGQHLIDSGVVKHSEILWVFPVNTQKMDFKMEFEPDKRPNAITFASLFKFSYSKEQKMFTQMSAETYNKILQTKNIKIIVFDEIYRYGFKELSMIQEFKDKYPEMTILATGDRYQLPPITQHTNPSINIKEHLHKAVLSIFRYSILLEHCKRCINDEQNQYMDRLAEKIRNGEPRENIMKFIEDGGLIKITDDVPDTSDNITAYHRTAKWVREEILYKREGVRHRGFVVGDVVICRGTDFKILSKVVKRRHLIIDFRYTILAIDNETALITDNLEDEETTLLEKGLTPKTPTTHQKLSYKISITDLNKNFVFNTAYTCHSTQGMTIKRPYTIYNAYNPLTSMYWLYTAIGRTNDLTNVYISKALDSNNLLTEKRIQKKIDGYKMQDANRVYDEQDYIDVDWIRNEIDKNGFVCYNCKQQMDLNGLKQWSVQRVDNIIPHVKSNCELWCLHCNKTAG